MFVRMLAFVFALIFAGCKESRRPTPLFQGLHSYSGFEAVKSRLGLNEGDWSVIEDTKIPERKGRPFYFFTIEVNDRTDLGVIGSIQLDFYNDRLMGSWFFPVDSALYKKNFEGSHGIRLNDKWEVKLEPRTIVKEGVDHRGRYYVGWIDATLNEEKNSQVD